jgi:hypothetical protein
LEPQLHDLEAALRSEIRLEAEEAEREAARSAAMRRTVRDIAADLMAHGDTVVARVSDQHAFEGRLSHVGADFLSIANRTSRIDVRLEALAHLGVAERALAGGRGPSRNESPAWRARLLELELSGRAVRIGLRGLEEELLGTVAVVGADHLSLAGPAGGAERFVPFAAVAYLRTGRTDEAEGDDV